MPSPPYINMTHMSERRNLSHFPTHWWPDSLSPSVILLDKVVRKTTNTERLWPDHEEVDNMVQHVLELPV
eukprot:1798242-Karenia_brevis.AAC.1